MMISRIFLGVLGMLALVAGDVVAAPPSGAPGTDRDWYQSLHQPDTGAGCCSIADCRHLPWRQAEGGYEVLVEDHWLAVPARVILHRENPTGSPVACVWGGQVRCFVAPPET